MKRFEFPEPSPKQDLFLTADNTYIAFGGARGGGKSWAVRIKAVLLCLNYPGIKVMIVRKTYPELQENHIIPLCEMLNCNAPRKRDRIASYNDGKKHIRFPNKSRILFRYCDKEKDVNNFQGTEVDVLFVDEATHQSESKIDKINACVRGTNKFPKRTYYTCNPGGEGHQWVKRLFIDKRYKETENPEEYTFIQSFVTDNKALMENDPKYMGRLLALPPKLRKAWLEGDWDIFEGQFFEDFMDKPDHYDDRRWTHVINPFDIPDGWKIYRSFDWGYNKPFSCMWFAVDYDGVAYHILEFYGCVKGSPNEGIKWTPPQVFAEIHRIETEHPWLKGKQIQGIADPAIWDAQIGESIADTAAKHQVFFSKGDHKRIPGWMQCHYRLAFDENGFPMFYVFKNCENFIRTIPLLQFDEHKVEDIDTDGEDHIADAWRYFLMSRPIKPRATPKPDEYVNSPLHTIFDIDKKDLTKRSARPKMMIINGG